MPLLYIVSGNLNCMAHVGRNGVVGSNAIFTNHPKNIKFIIYPVTLPQCKITFIMYMYMYNFTLLTLKVYTILKGVVSESILKEKYIFANID